MVVRQNLAGSLQLPQRTLCNTVPTQITGRKPQQCRFRLWYHGRSLAATAVIPKRELEESLQCASSLSAHSSSAVNAFVKTSI